MVKCTGLSRLGVGLLIAVFLNAVLMPGVASAKEADCEFDKKRLSFVHAQKVFDLGNYRCADIELNALINDKKTGLKDRAAARLLLVKVYNAMIHEDLSKPAEKPAAEPVEKPKSPAKDTKDTIVAKPPVAKAQSWAFDDKSGGKPWYKKWWAMALGIGVVATVAAVAGGGGDTTEEEAPPSALPPPPPPPGK